MLKVYSHFRFLVGEATIFFDRQLDNFDSHCTHKVSYYNRLILLSATRLKNTLKLDTFVHMLLFILYFNAMIACMT